MKKIAFEALIKELSIKSLVSGDKQARVLLEISSPSDEVIDAINRLQRADRFVAVALAEIKNE
jgi:hypothetical protein